MHSSLLGVLPLIGLPHKRWIAKPSWKDWVCTSSEQIGSSVKLYFPKLRESDRGPVMGVRLGPEISQDMSRRCALCRECHPHVVRSFTFTAWLGLMILP